MEGQQTALQAEALALLATLSTVGELALSFALQQEGRDPAGQEPERSVRQGIREDLASLHEMMLRGYALQHLQDGEADAMAFARHLDRLFVMRRISRLMHRLHQRLMSLYPACSESVLEQVRVLELHSTGWRHLAPEALRAHTTTLLPALGSLHASLSEV